jgi:glycosyltransferase involved in cell wall biosynthesis
MHICLLTPSFPPMVDGGVAIATGRLVQCLLQRGHRITVVTTAPPDKAGGSTNILPEVVQHGMTLHDGLVEDPLHAVPAVEALRVWAQARHQREPFDVILAYFIYPAGYLATVLGETLGVPVVCSCRGNDLSKDMFIIPESIAAVLTRSTRLICVSASLLHMADTLVPCRAKATVVANAVDSTLFAPDPSAARAAHSTVVIGTSGLMRWKKGIDLFLPLVRALCARHDVQILVAGYGLDAAIEQHITDFVERYNLRQRLEITGPLPHRQMVHALRRMDLYVNTSYQEGMPNGVLEAMACALPVVATDADGTPDLVQDGITGYLCPMGDLEALIARCHTLITQPSLRQCMGQAGRRRVQQHFQLDQEVMAVETVLQLASMERKNTTL